MSIIKILQTYLGEFDGLDLVLTDITHKDASSYAVTQSAYGQVTRDILGNVTYQNGYIFIAKERVGDEVDRQDNYDFLESFCAWLEERSEQDDLPALPKPYKATGIDVENVMLMDVEDSGLGVYQVQIQLTFEKER